MRARTPFRRRQEATRPQLDLLSRDRFTPGQRRAVGAAEAVAIGFGGTAAVLRYGLRAPSASVAIELGAVVVLSLVVLSATLVLRERASLTRETFHRRHWFGFLLAVVWAAGSAAVLAVGPDRLGVPAGTGRLTAFFVWSDLAILVRSGAGAVAAVRRVTAGGFNPALLLVESFAALIAAGTLLLLLPNCLAADAPELSWPDRVRVAAFTSTSAVCVNGLTVVPTGGEEGYWSRTGQAVILVLFQIGGLGIMTFAAFFALSTARSLRLREAATLRELFDTERPVDLRRLMFAVLGFTFGSELVGALLLPGLWPELPPGDRAFFCVFHSVSAFCNAGFDLTGESLLGAGTRWQIWGVTATLIIVGGLGFGTLYNLVTLAWARVRRGVRRGMRPGPVNGMAGVGAKVAAGPPVRATTTTRLVVVTTALLLAVGTAWVFFFEAKEAGTGQGASVGRRLADAWFQSVTFRSAGFNTVDHAELRPATKLFAIVLMFVGASPVSCGGGVKTATAAVVLLAIWSNLRGRPHAEVFGRTIPDEVVRRALTVVAVGGATLFAVTLLLAALEDESGFSTIDLAFEAASACGTVGATVGVSSRLTPASQVVLMAAMFLGRIGPLTLLLGLAGRRRPADYEYPAERVTLG